MNNLKERNPVPNGLQESSEDPPGFIYPSYRAAPTETLTDKPPLKGSHQGVAYVSSSVGGSVSTLSFEDSTSRNHCGPPMRRGGGSRDRVRGFSRASRRNLLRRLASINRRAFKGADHLRDLDLPSRIPTGPRTLQTTPQSAQKAPSEGVQVIRCLPETGYTEESSMAFPLAPVRRTVCWISR
jgi:hypothetical protein